MAKLKEPQFIESTAGEVASELARRGIAPGQRVTITIEPDDWLAKCVASLGRRSSRKAGPTKTSTV